MQTIHVFRCFVWGFFFFFLLFRKTWRTLLWFATALVAVKMRNVYTEFIVASLSPMRRDAALSHKGYKSVCIRIQHVPGETPMNRLDTEAAEAKPAVRSGLSGQHFFLTVPPGEEREAVKWSEQRLAEPLLKHGAGGRGTSDMSWFL